MTSAACEERRVAEVTLVKSDLSKGVELAQSPRWRVQEVRRVDYCAHRGDRPLHLRLRRRYWRGFGVCVERLLGAVWAG
jgi:hypothetical protein